MKDNNRTTGNKALTLVRTFKVPKEQVFQAFASAGAMRAWWGPAGMNLRIKSFDFREGGKFHYQTEDNQQTLWGLFTYLTIKRPDFIEFVFSFSDQEGNSCKPPFPMDFPLQVLNTITLVEHNGITTLTLQGHPLDATKEQAETYYSLMKNIEKGFVGTFDQLEKHLAEQIQKSR